jgi:sec-independent protein translocase protein TatA
MPGWIGPWELVILLIVILLVFGPKRLPEMGRSLGKGMREFKNSISSSHDDEKGPELSTPTHTVSEERVSPVTSRERDTVG